MAQLIADRRDIDFVLHEQLQVEGLSNSEKFADFNTKTVDLIVKEARQLSIKEILPTQALGDQDGCQFDKGMVTLPECYHRPWELLKEGEWVAITEDPDWGGQGAPKVVGVAAGEYLNGANFSLLMYAGLTHGAGKLVHAFGTQKQKELFLTKMFSGEWTGTMLLTEPQAGSDVGALETTAVKNDDGTYSITGNKIFISSGEHDLAENIIHPVLARIEGAPSGTKGISLFLVPKIWVNDDGTMGEPNDIVCTGIEEKMGIHGNTTCSMALGTKGRCRGLLLGEENKGMRAMFLMMNEARLLVGLQGFACASASYINALNYARERVQGRHLLQMADHNAPPVPIIQHPDIRRQLMTMKAYTEGMRSLLYFSAYCEDLKDTADDPAQKEKYQGLIEFLTPVAKGYVTDRAFDICSIGLQIFGGYGYIKEYPQEQLLRDCRITMIYEGTNGIQAMDLLGRKLGMNKGKPVMDLLGEVNQTIARAKAHPSTARLAETLEAAVNKLAEVSMHIGGKAMSPEVLQAFSFAHPFLEVCGDVIVGWMLLWRAVIAAEKLQKGARKKDMVFYEGVLKSADFFINTVLPVTKGKMFSILGGCDAAVEIAQESFGSK
jgi:alkylation response protein AidB-like acyl-CoA dehydrogenase